MNLHANNQSDSTRSEQVISQFLLKSLHIILDSRIPSLRPFDHSGDLSSGSRARKSDKWFSLVLGDRPAALDNLNFWHKNLMDPMIIDIILVQEGSNSLELDDVYTNLPSGAGLETVIERWVVQYESPRVLGPPAGEFSASYKKTYKKSIILLRSLYSTLRLLPAYRAFRQLSSLSQSSEFDIIYKVSSFCDPFSRADEGMMKQYSFVPVEALPGRLCISVTYRSTLSDFNLETSSSFPTKIITDYVGSPATDPLRAFSCSGKVDCATSFSLRGMQSPPTMPFQRPHSWTSGLHRATPFTQNQPHRGSPPVHRTSHMPYDFSSPPEFNGHRNQNYRPPSHQKATSFDEYQLSPPFSPSPSPSPPTYFFGGSPMQTRLSSETAPVTIPPPLLGRNSKYNSPNFSDPNRHSLPPLSPKSTRHDPLLQESPGISSHKKMEALRGGELCSGVTTHSGHKLFRDSKDDSGRFSGLLSSSGSPRIGCSRSSSRLSFQDDLDECEFSCPFVVDDVDASDTQASEKHEGRKDGIGMGRKSQDAAVGALVTMLRTAPPLRQDPSCYSHASAFFMPRKTADALEELRSYREIKDVLLSKSATRSIGG